MMRCHWRATAALLLVLAASMAAAQNKVGDPWLNPGSILPPPPSPNQAAQGVSEGGQHRYRIETADPSPDQAAQGLSGDPQVKPPVEPLNKAPSRPALIVDVADEPKTCLPTFGGFAPTFPPTPENAPRPAQGPRSVPAFVDGVSVTDAGFEVVIGQGRILTTKEDIAARGKTAALIALGDPGVVDFAVVGPRQVRVIARQIGTTDLSITTSDGRTYTFEVRVVVDLEVLRMKLHCLFPDASLKLSQIRENIVVEGQARSAIQVARIIETITAYLNSIQALNDRKIAAGQAFEPTTRTRTGETPAPVAQPVAPPVGNVTVLPGGAAVVAPITTRS